MKRIITVLILFVILSLGAFAERPAVIDALDYEKKVIVADYAANDGYNYGNHYIKLPKINVNSYGAQLLNEKMKEPYMDAYQKLVDNKEGNSIVRVDYEYKEEEGIIGIIIKDVVTVQEGGGATGYKAFYYDSNNDKVLSFDEYLDTLNVTKSKIAKSSAVVKAYKDAGQPDNPVILDAILDSDSSLVIVKEPWGMNGWMTVDLTTPAVKVSPRKKDDLYVGRANELVIKIGSKSAYVDGKIVENDVAPIIANGRTMLPARFVVENLGGKISWNEPEQKVTITKGSIKIELIINSDVATVNGNKVKLDCPVFIQNGRTYTPVRFIVETLEATVDWYAYTEQVVIYKNASVADMLYEYYTEHKDEFVLGGSIKPDSAFIADLDGDFVPELLLDYGHGGYNSWINVVKYKSGQIYMTDTNIFSGMGTGISSNFELVYDDSGSIFIWHYYASYNPFDYASYIEEFTAYNWHENDHEIRYFISLDCDKDGYFYSKDPAPGSTGIKITEQEFDDFHDEVNETRSRYDNSIIDLERTSLFSVWNKQKELAASN